MVFFHEEINNKELESGSVFPSPTLVNSMLRVKYILFLSWGDCLLKDPDLGSRLHVDQAERPQPFRISKQIVAMKAQNMIYESNVLDNTNEPRSEYFLKHQLYISHSINTKHRKHN